MALRSPSYHLRRSRRCLDAGQSSRCGTSAVELAVCLPVLMLVIIGSLECSGMIFLNQSLHIAAYEGARVAIRSDATNAEVIDRANDILSVRNVILPSLTVNPSNVSGILSGQTLTVTLSAPCDANSLLPPWFFGGMTLVGQTTMVKE